MISISSTQPDPIIPTSARKRLSFITNPWFKVAFLLVILVLLRLPSLSLPLDRDEGAYAYIGWRWLTTHELPYQDYFEMKPPLLHLVYGAISIFFGNTGSGVRIASLIYSGFIVILFYLFASRVTNRQKAFWMTLLLTVLLTEYRIQTVLFNAEMLLLLPLIGWMWLIWEGIQKRETSAWLWLCAGILGGLAILFKQIALYPIGIISVWVLIERKKIQDLVCIGFGILLPWLFFILYFWHRNALEPFIAHLGTYASESTRNGFAISRLCQTQALSGICLGEWISRFHPTLGPLAVGALAGFLIHIRKRTPLWWIGLGTTLGMLIAIKGAGWKDWPHYYLLLIPGIIIGITFTIKKMEEHGWNHSSKLWGILILLTFTHNFPLMVGSPTKASTRQFETASASLFTHAPTVARWIRTNVPSTESLVVWSDEAEIYYYSKRKSHSRFLYYYLFELRPNGTEQTQWYQTQLAHPPLWIVVHPHALWGMDALLQQFFTDVHEKYSPKTSIGPYTVYQKETL